MLLPLDVVGVHRVLAERVLVLYRVMVNAINGPPRFPPSGQRWRFGVHHSLEVRARFLYEVVARARLIFLGSREWRPIATRHSPMLRPLWVNAQLARGFRLRLLGLSHARYRVPQYGLVARELTSLSGSGQGLLAKDSLRVFRIGRGALYNFQAGVCNVFYVFHGSLRYLGRRVGLASIYGVVLATKEA